MSDTNDPTKGEEIDFMSSPSLQKAVKRSKRKQTLKYVFIAMITTTILIFVIFSGSQFILIKRIENMDPQYNNVYGANISYRSTSFNYNLFSVTAETTYQKNIGDRSIVWDKETKKIPVFGRISTIERGSGSVEVIQHNTEANRYVRYNDFNNERKIDFYYPGLSYDYLPHELDIAASLDKNKLIEVALSFNEPMILSEVEKKLGLENVNWLWVDTTTVSQMQRMEKELDGDDLKTKGGGGAFGFDVTSNSHLSKEYEKGFIKDLEQIDKKSASEALKGIKENIKITKGKLRINGAVVSGTPNELKRFQNLDFIRASVLGATIDKY